MCPTCNYHRDLAAIHRNAAKAATSKNSLTHLELAVFHDARIAEHRYAHPTRIAALWRQKNEEKRSAAAMEDARQLRPVSEDETGPSQGSGDRIARETQHENID